MEPIKVDHNELEELISHNYERKLPLYVWGSFGIGKSETVRRVAQEESEAQGRQFVDWDRLNRSERDEVLENPGGYFVFVDERLQNSAREEVNGVPDISGDYIELKAYRWTQAITAENGAGIVFLDELNLAHNSVQSAAYSLIHDRKIGGDTLSDEVWVVAAGNRAEDRAKVRDMAAPLKNRFGHVTLKKPQGGKSGLFTKYLQQKEDPEADERVVSYWGSPQGADKVFMFGRDGNESGKVWATPRTIEMASDAIKGVEDLDTAETVMAQYVSPGVAAEWRAFMELREDVDMDRLLDEPEYVNEIEDKGRIDLMHSVLTGVASEYNNDTDLLDTVVEIASHINKREFGVLLLRHAREYHPRHFGDNIMDIEAFDDLSMDFVKYLDIGNKD